MVQGVYYYFYQIFRNRAEAGALEQKRLGIGDGSVGMMSSLFVAALSGYNLLVCKEPLCFYFLVCFFISQSSC